ncbi:MAG TPA: bacteriohemerythrin [Holophagaceae bacterium]
MAVAIWSSRFETGIPIIDKQHQTLFEAVNRLADSFKNGTASSQVKASLDFLVSYTAEHFQTEEKHMKEMGYPKLAAHVVEHKSLLAKAQDLQAKLAEGKPVTVEVTAFLADWLKHHINEVDMGYVEFAKAKAKAKG